ncbi:hypothetical protein D3C76_1880440 [compost metagenome]
MVMTGRIMCFSRSARLKSALMVFNPPEGSQPSLTAKSIIKSRASQKPGTAIPAKVNPEII